MSTESKQCSQYLLYWMSIKYIVYITFGFITIQIKWMFEFVFRSLYIQTLIRRKSESMENRTRTKLSQSIFFGILLYSYVK